MRRGENANEFENGGVFGIDVCIHIGGIERGIQCYTAALLYLLHEETKNTRKEKKTKTHTRMSSTKKDGKTNDDALFFFFSLVGTSYTTTHIPSFMNPFW